MRSLRTKTAALRGLSGNPRLAWLGEEKLAWMEQTSKRLQASPVSLVVPVSLLVGAVAELKPTDTLWLPQAKPVRKALKPLDWPGNRCGPEIVSSWKAAREASSAATFGRATLVVFCKAEAERKANCQRAVAKAGKARLAMVFVEETFTDAPPRQESLPHEPGGADFPRILVDADDLIAVFRVAQEAIQRARRGQGPSSVLCLRRPDPAASS